MKLNEKAALVTRPDIVGPQARWNGGLSPCLSQPVEPRALAL